MNRRLLPFIALGATLVAPVLASAQDRSRDGARAPSAGQPAAAARPTPGPRPSGGPAGRGGGFPGYRPYEHAFPGGVRGDGGDRVGGRGPAVAPGSGGYGEGAEGSGPPVAPGSGGYRSGADRGNGGFRTNGGPPVAPGSGGYRWGGDGGYRGGFGANGGPPVAPGSGGYRSGAGRGEGGYRGGDGRGGYGWNGGGYAGRGGGYGWRGAAGGGSRSYHGRNYPRFRGPAFSFPRGYSYRRYAVGAYLPRVFLYDSFFLNDWNAYYLSAPPGPEYRWVRYGPDALLVDVGTGEVADVAYGVFEDGSGGGDDSAWDGERYAAPAYGDGSGYGDASGYDGRPPYSPPAGYGQPYGEDDDGYGPPPR